MKTLTDARKLFLSRGIRGLVDGLVSIALASPLTFRSTSTPRKFSLPLQEQETADVLRPRSRFTTLAIDVLGGPIKWH
jgi:hypothetical protein